MPPAIRVLALVPYPVDTTPSQRFRLEQWRPYLAQDGIELTFVPFATPELMQYLYKPGHFLRKSGAITRAVLDRLGAVLSSRRYDAVIVHRALCIAGPAWIERLLAKVKQPLFFDFDDAIFLLHTTDVNRHLGWLKFPGKTATICRLSRHVTVGNGYLADYARAFNSRVTIIPTSIDTDVYRPRARSPSKRLVVGWTGSSTSQTHLEMFLPVLLRLVATRDVEIRVISNREPVLPGLPAVWRPWNPETEVDELASLDVGIMPMPDDQWSRGKCALKALQYMAMGIPTIATNAGANREVIEHDANGLLAASDDEWLACLQRMIDDAPLRARLGAAGRTTIEERYSMRRCAEALARVIRSELPTGTSEA